MTRLLTPNNFLYIEIHTQLIITTFPYYDLASKTTDDSDIFYEKLFMAILFTLRAFANNLLRGNREAFFSYFILFDLGFEPGPHI